MLVTGTIAALVALTGYAWCQAKIAADALHHAEEEARQAEADKDEAEQQLRTANQAAFERSICYHVLGIELRAPQELHAIMQALEHDARARQVLQQYEKWEKSLGQELPFGRRSYPELLAHLSSQIDDRD